MKFKYIDMENYKRKKHFDHFSSLLYPYVGTTVNIDISDFLGKVKEYKLPFFLTFCYCVSNAANSVTEFKQRILNGKIIEYEYCKVSHTVALENETYCYCNLDINEPFDDYLPYAIKELEKAKSEKSLEDKDDINDKFLISTLPWVSYTSFIQPVPIPADSNPRITWGKYFMQDERILIPVSVLCNHALVDGIHISHFYKNLNAQLSTFSECYIHK